MDSEIAPEIADLKARAEAANISITDALRRAGVASTTWGRWESGAFDPRLSTLRRIRKAIDEMGEGAAA